MKQLSSHLSKPRRRIYGLLTAGGLIAFGAAAVGGLIVALGHSSPDVTLPFWECGEYVLLLGLVNLGIYAAVFWQMGRLTRREGRRPEVSDLRITAPGQTDDLARPTPPAASPGQGKPPGVPPQVSRQVRGTVSSLNLYP